MFDESPLPDGYCFHMVQADQCFGSGHLMQASEHIDKAESFSDGSDYCIGEIKDARAILKTEIEGIV